MFQDKVVLRKCVLENGSDYKCVVFKDKVVLRKCVLGNGSDYKCVVFKDKVVLWKCVMETEVTISVWCFRTRWSCLSMP